MKFTKLINKIVPNQSNDDKDVVKGTINMNGTGNMNISLDKESIDKLNSKDIETLNKLSKQINDLSDTIKINDDFKD